MNKKWRRVFEKNSAMALIIPARSKCIKILAQLGLHFGESSKVVACMVDSKF